MPSRIAGLVLNAFICLALLTSSSARAATRTWAGSPVAPYNWSQPANWVGAIPPSNGDDVIFGPTSGLNSTNDISTLSALNSITITEQGHNVSGNSVQLLGDVSYTVGSGGTSSISMPLSFDVGAHLVTGGNPAALLLGDIDMGMGDVTFEDKVALLGNLNGLNDMTIAGTPATFVKLAGGSTTYGGTAFVGAGATLMVEGDYLFGTLTVDAAPGSNLLLRAPGRCGIIYSDANVRIGELPVVSQEASRFEVTDMFLTGGTLTVDINGLGAGTGYDQIYAGNAISLSGVSLNLRKLAGFTPTGGTTFRILEIDPSTFTGLTGTFTGLPHGTIINAGGVDFRILYDFYGVSLEVPSATRIWSGNAGGGPLWSLGPNWDAGLAPVPGSNLIFPGDVTSYIPTNDLADGFSITHIDINAGGYTLSGNRIALSDGIDLPAEGGGGAATISMPITFNASQTVNAGRPLTLSGDLQVGDLTVLMGEIGITGNLSGNGSLAIQGSPTFVEITSTSTMGGVIQAQSGGFLTFKGTHSGSLSVQSDSTLAFEGAVGQLQVSGIFLVAGDGTSGAAAGQAVTFGAFANVRADILSDSSYDSIEGNSINLGNAELDVRAGNFTPSPGSTFTIVRNTSNAPTVGRFRNFAEGATITIGGATLQISYVGGTGNDVVFTTVGGCTVSIVAATTVKSGSTGNVAALSSTVPGSNYNWTVSNGTITAGQGTPQIVFTAGTTGTVQISVSVTGACVGTTTHTATIERLPAVVILSSNPDAIVLRANSGAGGSTSYTLTNIGDTGSSITLSQRGSFFTQSPPSFALAAGASQTITINVGPQTTSGTQSGASTPQGQGVPAGLTVPVTLLVSAPPPTGTPNVIATIDRIDLSAARGQNPRGSASFQNIGSALATGVPSSDVPWIIPDPTGVISIAPGSTIPIGFTIDRTQRPDATLPTGSVAGTLSFVYATSGAGARGTYDAPSLSASVPVTDTVKPPSSAGVIPPLAQGEVALLVPGVGNVVGSGGKLFVSDMTLLNKSPLASVSDAKLFYIAPGGQTTQANLDPVVASGSVSLANVVSTVFNQSQQVGTLMIRSSQVNNMVVNATIFNDNNPRGRYGTVIPILRSDNAVAPGQRLVISGVKRDSTSHTNLYIQEMKGVTTIVTARFFDADANQVGPSLPLTIQPFALTQAVSAIPAGAVTAAITNDSGGSILGYATPVDDAEGGGDTWAQADWNRQYTLAGTEPLLVPVAGAIPGANQTYFRTDLTITNTGVASSTAKVRYTAGAIVVEKSVTLAPLATAVLNDVVAVFLGVTPPSIGSIVITPQGGSFAATSRTYSSTQGSAATFGTATPTVALASGLVVGQSRLIAGLEDSKQSTVLAATPKTARTNFGLVETKGQPATVKVSLLLNDGRSLAFGDAKGSKTFDLGANQFLLVPSMTKTILGDARETQFGDLKNVMVKFEIVGGSGGVVPFVTSTDNGTGDTILRNE